MHKTSSTEQDIDWSVRFTDQNDTDSICLKGLSFESGSVETYFSDEKLYRSLN